MSVDPTRRDEALTHFYIPQALFLISAAFRLSPLTLVLLFCVPVFIGRRWLLLNWIAMALINYPTYTSGFSWVGLMPTYYMGFVVAQRLGLMQVRPRQGAGLQIAALLVLAVNFVLLSLPSYYSLTGVKSSLQLGFALILTLLLRRVEHDDWIELREQLRTVLPTHLILYVIAGAYVWRFAPALPSADVLALSDDTKLRFNGLCGAQVCAFSFSVLLAFYWLNGRRAHALGCLAVVALTGSRTYVGAAVVVLVLPTLAGNLRLQTRVALGVLVVVVTGAGLYLLPLISDRFVMNDEFYGSLLGRFLNYESAVDHIRASPLFGEGMGAMLQVLEEWSPLAFEQYLAAGDTTIMHNEYLRVAMEGGIVAIALCIGLLAKAWRGQVLTARAIVLVLLIGSLTENTLAGYSTGMIIAIGLWYCTAGCERTRP